MARHFNGSSDQINFATISSQLSNVMTGTMVAVIKRTNNSGWHGICSLSDGGFNALYLDCAPSGNGLDLWANYEGGSNSPTIDISSADGWVIIAASKGSGNVAVRFHKYNFGTSTWQHEDGPATGDDIVTSTDFILGNAFGDRLNGDIDVVAYWGTALTDPQIESLAADLTNWDSLSPAGMWVLDQASVATPVTDRTGNGTDQTSIVGTSVVAGSPLTTGGGSTPKSGSDTISVTEDASVVPSGGVTDKSGSDTITVSDDESIVAAPNDNEIITFTESADVVIQGTDIFGDDNISITESSSLQAGGLVSVNDNIGITETADLVVEIVASDFIAAIDFADIVADTFGQDFVSIVEGRSVTKPGAITTAIHVNTISGFSPVVGRVWDGANWQTYPGFVWDGTSWQQFQ